MSDQARAALVVANDVRVRRAALKRQLAAGEVTLAEALADPVCAKANLATILMCVPNMGRTTTNVVLKRIGASPFTLVGALTVRQRGLLGTLRAGRWT